MLQYSNCTDKNNKHIIPFSKNRSHVETFINICVDKERIRVILISYNTSKYTAFFVNHRWSYIMDEKLLLLYNWHYLSMLGTQWCLDKNLHPKNVEVITHSCSNFSTTVEVIQSPMNTFHGICWGFITVSQFRLSILVTEFLGVLHIYQETSCITERILNTWKD